MVDPKSADRTDVAVGMATSLGALLVVPVVAPPWLVVAAGAGLLNDPPVALAFAYLGGGVLAIGELASYLSQKTFDGLLRWALQRTP